MSSGLVETTSGTERRRVLAQASFAQQRAWLMDRLESNSAPFSIPVAVRLRGALDVAALASAVSGLIARHEALRTTFAEREGEPVQVIHAAAPVAVRVEELGAGETVAAWVAAEVMQPFELSVGPLVRVRLLRVGAAEHVVVLTMHHIVSDGWSVGVVVRELSALYAAARAGTPAALPAVAVQYADYAAWQRREMTGARLGRELAYWTERLAGAPPVLEVPTDRPRPAVRSNRGASVAFTVDAAVRRELEAVGRRTGATLYMVVLAAWQVLLGRYSGQTDVVVGTPIAGRVRPELEGVVGLFVNSLALRTDLSGDPTFTEVVRRVRETALGAYEHQEVPFERVVEALAPERNLSHTPVFQAMVAWEIAAESDVQLPGITTSRIPVERGVSRLDLSLFMTDSGDRLSGVLEYNTDVFNHDRIVRMTGHLRRLLSEIARSPERKIASYPIVTPEEQGWLLEKGTSTATAYPDDHCIQELVEEQVASTPNAIAVEYGVELLTYAHLNARANQLARRLRAHGVRPETLVGICLDRSVAMVVAMLAVLKAGGAYVPLDPSYPPERLAFMLDDTAAPLLITSARLAHLIPASHRLVLTIDGAESAMNASSTSNLDTIAGPDNLAYVIYTSGSTGRPKGSAIVHRAVNRLFFNTNYLTIEPSDRVAQASSASFDPTTYEVWGALCRGARVVGVTDDPVLAPDRFRARLRETGITVMWMTTGVLHHVVRVAPDTTASLRALMFGGEPADADALRTLIEAGGPRRLLNMYGPTECTVFATWHVIDAPPPSGVPIPIGRPIANSEVLVLDHGGQLAPIGVAAELYIAGDGLGRTFHGRPALTADRFRPHPYATRPGQRAYKTNDLVRWRADGALDFLGRVDRQFKIRGFRVELGEIEAVLREHPAIRDAVVVVSENAGPERDLIAYVIGRDQECALADDDTVRAFLARRVPPHMVPAAIVPVTTFPLTPNGKVDRRALPAPAATRPRTATGGEEPRTPTEVALADIWADVLGVGVVGRSDNFFARGGHSFKAVRLVVRIRERFGRALPLGALYAGATIESIARQIDSSVPIANGPLVPWRVSGTRRPFFCVHAIGGELHPYAALVERLGEDQPAYGLQSIGLAAERPPLMSIEEMARAYIEAIRAVQLRGPYVVGGHSMGGTIAYEMAQQLRAAGEPVGLLALFDTRGQANFDHLDHAPLLGRLLADLLPGDFAGEVGRTPSASQAAFAVECAERVIVEPSYLLNLLRVFRANDAAVRAYAPRPYRGRVVLFESTDESERGEAQPATYWSRVALGGLIVRRVPGLHRTMLEEPHVSVLATSLREYLETTADIAREDA
jgi:amino acid adenylation domain-containing protein